VFEEYNGPEIKNLQIPDSDLENWIDTLLEGGLNYPDIDGMLAKLNPNYAKLETNQRAEAFMERLNDFLEKHPDKLSENSESGLLRIREKFLEQTRKAKQS